MYHLYFALSVDWNGCNVTWHAWVITKKKICLKTIIKEHTVCLFFEIKCSNAFSLTSNITKLAWEGRSKERLMMYFIMPAVFNFYSVCISIFYLNNIFFKLLCFLQYLPALSGFCTECKWRDRKDKCSDSLFFFWVQYKYRPNTKMNVIY